jgi:hypothetical protein
MSQTPEYGDLGADTEQAKELKNWIDETWSEVTEQHRS